MARAWPRAMSLPRKPAVAASVMAAVIASGVVGIGYDPIVDGPNKGGMAVDVQADTQLFE
jgi:hypothetical protein